jgi:hypothetical protein
MQENCLVGNECLVHDINFIISSVMNNAYIFGIEETLFKSADTMVQQLRKSHKPPRLSEKDVPRSIKKVISTSEVTEKDAIFMAATEQQKFPNEVSASDAKAKFKKYPKILVSLP